MSNAPLHLCYAIPPHILARIAEQSSDDVSRDARATLEHMHELAPGTAAPAEDSAAVAAEAAAPPPKRRNVCDARHQLLLPGVVVMTRHKTLSADVEVAEAYDACGATYDFLWDVMRRASLDGRGMRLDATVHYGIRFLNAFWNGRQMVYGDGDGRVFQRFTARIELTAHALTHRVLQDVSPLGGNGQAGALLEHLCDVFALMVKQYALGQSARESDWLIGAGIFGPGIKGVAIRSLAAPGMAYDDPLLGRDPQPWHMSDYVRTPGDDGGAHINSGIPNHAFYLAATTLGGNTWEVLRQVWYAALTERVKPEANFADFARATVDIAGEFYGNGGHVQRTIAEAWGEVGLTVPIFGCASEHPHLRRRRRRAVTARRAAWSSQRRTR